MEQEMPQQASLPDPLLDASTTYHLEFDGVARRFPARASFGFAISAAADGQLVAVGNGVLPAGWTCSQTECSGLIEGLKVAHSLGIKRLKAYGASELVVKQIQHRTKTVRRALQPQLPEVRELAEGFDAFQVAHMERPSDSLAEGLATLAVNVDALLLEAGTCPPSHYSRVARRLGAALLLRREAVAHLDGADNFPQAVIQAVASRLRVDAAAVAARMQSLAAWKERKQPCSAEGLRVTRTFTPAEGPIMTAALSAMRKSEGLTSTAAAAQLLIATPADVAALLPELQLQEVAGSGGAEELHAPALQRHGGDADDVGADDGTRQGFVASALQGIEGMQALEGLVLGDEVLSDAMQVQDGRVTHLLMFDGASKGNPGRAAFGYAIFDLYSKQLSAKGCRTLPYGRTAHDAEYHGLNAGLEAAVAKGIKRIMVHGDAALVVEQVMYRRCTSSSSVARLFHRSLQLITMFEHFEIQLVPRELNRVADRLAQISIDIDGVLYTLLRKDMRGDMAMALLLKGARLYKRNDRVSRLLRQQEFPVLLVALLQALMSLPPRELLQRLEDKAAAMGDPNPWLVQEVRRIVNSGPVAFSGSAASEALLQDGRTKAARANYRVAIGDDSYWRLTGRPKGSGRAVDGAGDAAAGVGGGGAAALSGGNGGAGVSGGRHAAASSRGNESRSSSSSSNGGDASANADSSITDDEGRAGSVSSSGAGGHVSAVGALTGAQHYSSITHSSSNSWHSRTAPLQHSIHTPLLAARQPSVPPWAACAPPAIPATAHGQHTTSRQARPWPQLRVQLQQQPLGAMCHSYSTSSSHRRHSTTAVAWPHSLLCALAAANAMVVGVQPTARFAGMKRLVASLLHAK